MSAQSLCSVDDCDGHVLARGLCNRHYKRLRRHGDPLTILTKHGQARGFLHATLHGSAPRESNGCVLWPFAVDQDGYPYLVVHRNHRLRVTHLVLEHFHGLRPSPQHGAGHALHEVCGSKRCIAPEHLSWQTAAEQRRNQRRDDTMRFPIITGEAHPRTFVSDEKAVGLIVEVLEGRSARAVAREAGLGLTTVRHWVSGRNRPELLARARQALADSVRKGKAT